MALVGSTARRFGRSVRVIRIRLGLRQVDAAARAGVSQPTWSRIESGRIETVDVGVLSAMLEALGGHLDLRAVWRGATLDRLLDEGHAALVGAVVRILEYCGWSVWTEVTFSEWGERGSIDVLAWHAATDTLLVVEVKTELGSLGELLRRLDAKARLAPRIARDRYGHRARSVGRLLVMADDRSQRRAVARHDGVLRSALPMRGWDVRRWLGSPSGVMAGLWFLSPIRGMDAPRNRSAVRRVRRRSTADPTLVHARCGSPRGSESAVGPAEYPPDGYLTGPRALDGSRPADHHRVNSWQEHAPRASRSGQ